MHTKTIKSVLRRKVDAWLSTIKDDRTRELVKDNVMVTGGSIVSMLLNEKPKDYDIYLTSREAVFALARYYVTEFNAAEDYKVLLLGDPFSAGTPESQREDLTQYSEWSGSRLYVYVASDGVAESAESEAALGEADEEAEQPVTWGDDSDDKKPKATAEYRPRFLTSNAISLTDGVQLIVRFYGSPEEIHKNFDFAHCKGYWLSGTGELVLPPDMLLSVVNKRLVYQGSKYPVCSVFRLRKFIRRGWTIDAGQVLKILMQVSQLDLSSVDVLREQLIGVDVSYFQNMLMHIEKHPCPTGVEFSGYLSEVIDRFF